VQLYVRDVVGSRVRPLKELKGFRRVTLQSGERRTLSFRLTPAELGFYNDAMRFVVEPGVFKVMAGRSSADPEMLEATFEVTAR
jgi:beta-glucosidase